MKRTVVVLLTLGALAYFMACTSRVGLPPKNFGSKSYFIPMGDFPTDQMQRLADYYNQRFGLEIPILKSIPVSVSAVDNNRGLNSITPSAPTTDSTSPRTVGGAQVRVFES